MDQLISPGHVHHLLRLTNIKVSLSATNDIDKLWEKIMELVKNRLLVGVTTGFDCQDINGEVIGDYNIRVEISDEQMNEALQHIESQFSLTTKNDIIEGLTEEEIESAAQMFVFIAFCPGELINWSFKPFNRFIGDMINENSAKMILTVLKRLQIQELYPQFSKRLFTALNENMNFQFNQIEKLTGSQNCDRGCNFTALELLDDKILPKITNHPVHIDPVPKDWNPSALIPFCWLGHEAIGTKIEQFRIPICDRFRAVLRNDQLCYEINPNEILEYKDQQQRIEGIKKGLLLVIDENKDRQSSEETQVLGEYEKYFSENNFNSDDVNIFLDVIGRYICSTYASVRHYMVTVVSTHYDLGSPILTPGWKYNLNIVKDKRATKDFLEREDKGCSLESYDNCTTRIYVDKVIKKCGCLPLSMIQGFKDSKVI